ncbi:hypothetical protein BS50DRAFT_591465 [Corynespora cassiicola Philippines]|uniref:Uncharacterized protein n=1 Tax=Corynespora cassiicola Philippines TaxID=1448308 RepID=A0A2T2NCX1_CORCC|nr:hypothetical protein BS50DRAFT_591465 [Corynespora cassiicola Philippines]
MRNRRALQATTLSTPPVIPPDALASKTTTEENYRPKTKEQWAAWERKCMKRWKCPPEVISMSTEMIMGRKYRHPIGEDPLVSRLQKLKPSQWQKILDSQVPDNVDAKPSVCNADMKSRDTKYKESLVWLRDQKLKKRYVGLPKSFASLARNPVRDASFDHWKNDIHRNCFAKDMIRGKLPYKVPAGFIFNRKQRRYVSTPDSEKVFFFEEDEAFEVKRNKRKRKAEFLSENPQKLKKITPMGFLEFEGRPQNSAHSRASTVYSPVKPVKIRPPKHRIASS